MSTDQNWFPEAWRPQAGESITGTVVDVNVAEGGYGAYPVVTLRVADAEREYDIALHAFHDMLRHELARRRVQAGDVVTVTYLGKHEKGYHGYRVAGAERPFDWSQFGGAETRPAALPSAPPPPPAAPAAADPDDIPF